MMENNRLLLIYNPKAGKGLFLNHLAEVIDLFTKAGFAVEVYPTQAPGDAITKIRRLTGEYCMIVPAGGDGTLDEVVTGLINSGKTTPIGYIPVGSTNDFASSLGISNKVLEAVGGIIAGQPRGVDAGIFNSDHVFVYVAAFGAFTDVAYQTDQELKNTIGHAAYIVEALKRIGDLKKYEIEVRTPEGTVRNEYVFGMITNSTQVGGIRNITGRDVALNDGVFEITLVRNPKNLIEMSEIVSALLTQNYDTEMIDFFKSEWIELVSDDEIPWTLDGEYGGSWKEVRVENQRYAIRLVLEPSNKRLKNVMSASDDGGDRK